jgi:putative ABC transport system ATP-binding protein
MTIYSVKKLQKDYKLGDVTTRALRGVDLEIHEREFTAIAGPSGSGKSTLLHLMGALDTPSQGEVWLNGQRIDHLGKLESAKLRLWNIGFVFQAYNLIPVMTALENAAFVLELRGVSKKEREAKALAALEALDMANYADRRPNQLSGGQQQRVAVARALAADPRIILADEPTANLDKETGQRLVHFMQELNETRGITFVFSTHDPRLLDQVKRIVNLEDGHITDEQILAKH